MAALRHRAYAGEADRDAVLDLWLAARATSAGDPWPCLDSLDAELAARPQGSADIGLWEDEHGRLVGAAMLEDGCILVWRTLAGADDDALDLALIAWGLERVAGAARGSGERPSLFVPICSEDRRLATLLARAGFQEDDWRTLRMARPLRASLPAAEDPPGVRIRPAAGAADLAAATALHAALFAGRGKTMDERAVLMRAPGYRPTLDLVAALEGGAVAGYALGTCGALERRRLGQAVGWLEFVGVAQGQRGRGIGRALVLRLLGAMREEGLDTVLLTTGATNGAARRLFGACGFQTLHEIRWFVRDTGR